MSVAAKLNGKHDALGAPKQSREVYRAISRITAAFAKLGIGKVRFNQNRGFDYRSIDDLQERLAPMLAKHSLVVIPRVLRRSHQERVLRSGTLMTAVDVHVAFDFICTRDGSKVTAEVFGESWDEEDKATAKALTAAYKTAMFQTFCIPVAKPDPDEAREQSTSRIRSLEPTVGWNDWTDEKITWILACEDPNELDDLIESNANLLQTLSAERPDCYRRLCETLKRVNQSLGPVPNTQSIEPNSKVKFEWAGQVSDLRKELRTAPSPREVRLRADDSSDGRLFA